MIGLRSSFRRMLGAFVNLGEDPELLLGHLFEDLRAVVPRLDQQLDWLASGIRLLEQELAGQDEQEASLTARIRAATAKDRADVAAALGERLEAIREARSASRAQLEVLQESYAIAREVKRESLQRMQDRCREVARCLPADAEASWREEISRTVSEAARAHLDPELDARVEEIRRRASEEEERRPAPSGDADADIQADAERLADHPEVRRARST